MDKNCSRLVVEIPQDLHAACKVCAEQDGRLLKGWVKLVLQSAVDAHVEFKMTQEP